MTGSAFPSDQLRFNRLLNSFCQNSFTLISTGVTRCIHVLQLFQYGLSSQLLSFSTIYPSSDIDEDHLGRFDRKISVMSYRQWTLENNKLQIYENSKFSNSIEQENMRMLYKKKHQCPTFLNWHIILERATLINYYSQKLC
ncbi:hypothetical protein Tsp_10470 [Trichinella spiralis]|uniref:hypothetical protein n=1 Tax=Trichinella spiralis TaxID=6334 RepID=UPI0001EFF065|nr:hypothetical protein Tsp_10470 [Trichinella spiralis]